MRTTGSVLFVAMLLFCPALLYATPCFNHEDCPIDHKCDAAAGECVALGDSDCRQDTDCPDIYNEYCDLRLAACRYYCSMDAHCIDDPEAGIVEYCDLDTNRCEPVPDEDGDEDDRFCREDWDCAVGEYCDLATRRCVPRCTGDVDCPEGEVCMAGRCKDPEGGDDDPWDYPDDPEDGDEDEFVVPDDYEMPGSGDGEDEEDLGGSTTGGLSGCPPGQVCVRDGDEDTDDDDAGGCRQSPAAALPLFFGLMLAALGLRRRRVALCQSGTAPERFQ